MSYKILKLNFQISPKCIGKYYFRIELSEVLTNTQRWLSASTNGIDSEDAKLIEQVTLGHRSHWGAANMNVKICNVFHFLM